MSSSSVGMDVLGAAERLLYDNGISRDERFGDGCDGAQRLDAINKMYGVTVDPH